MRLIVLHNPTSGDEEHGRRDLEALLQDAGHDVVYRSLGSEGLREVFSEPHDLVVVAGGDGSVRKVFTALGGARTTIALLPTGSANNIARTLGIETDTPADLVAGWERARRSRFDLWEVTAPWGDSRCVEAVGGGLFAEVLTAAAEARDEPSGDEKVDFGLQLLLERLAETRPATWTLELDGRHEEAELLGVAAMNVRELGPNLPLAPGADPGDGCLDVVLIRPEDRTPLAAYLEARLLDDAAPAPRLECRRVSELVVEPPEAARMHVDDLLPAWDAGTTRWVEIRRAEVGVEVLVPDGTGGGDGGL